MGSLRSNIARRQLLRHYMRARAAAAAIMAAGAVVIASLVAIAMPLVLALSVYAGDVSQVGAALVVAVGVLVVVAGLAVLSARLATVASTALGGPVCPSRPWMGVATVLCVGTLLVAMYLLFIVVVASLT
jgi:hypothetical protein